MNLKTIFSYIRRPFDENKLCRNPKSIHSISAQDYSISFIKDAPEQTNELTGEFISMIARGGKVSRVQDHNGGRGNNNPASLNNVCLPPPHFSKGSATTNKFSRQTSRQDSCVVCFCYFKFVQYIGKEKSGEHFQS